MSRDNNVIRIKLWSLYSDCSAFSKNPCFCCRQPLEQARFVIGHVVPASDGGQKTVDNCRPICQTCNSSMKNNNMFKWMKEKGFERDPCLKDGCYKPANCGWYCEDHKSLFNDALFSDANLELFKKIESMSEIRRLKKDKNKSSTDRYINIYSISPRDIHDCVLYKSIKSACNCYLDCDEECVGSTTTNMYHLPYGVDNDDEYSYFGDYFGCLPTTYCPSRTVIPDFKIDKYTTVAVIHPSYEQYMNFLMSVQSDVWFFCSYRGYIHIQNQSYLKEYEVRIFKHDQWTDDKNKSQYPYVMCKEEDFVVVSKHKEVENLPVPQVKSRLWELH